MIVTFGEAMIRLTPPGFQRLEQAHSLQLDVGGAELNTAAGLARLGHTVEWVSVLPDNPVGRLVRNRAREAAVGTTRVQFSDEGRCGLYFLEQGAAPRASSVLYDREHASVTRVSPGGSGFWGGWKPGTFHWKEIFENATWFHVSGITPALGAGCAAATAEALKLAQAAGVHTSLDLNYRSKLWEPATAGRVLRPLLHRLDLLIATEADAQLLFGFAGDTFAQAARQFAEKFGIRYVAGVRREADLVWRNRFGAVGYADGHLFETPLLDVEVVDRLGAGDAFAAGVIHGLCRNDFELGLRTGAAMGALQQTMPGDLPWMTTDDIAAVLAGDSLRINR